MKILVVDDSSTMRRIIKNTLQRLGHQEILEAEHGLEAWNLLTQNEGIEGLITDWNMPAYHNGNNRRRKSRSYNSFKSRC